MDTFFLRNLNMVETAIHSSLNVSLNFDPMQSTFSINSDVSLHVAFLDPILYKWSFGVCSENGFRDS